MMYKVEFKCFAFENHFFYIKVFSAKNDRNGYNSANSEKKKKASIPLGEKMFHFGELKILRSNTSSFSN